MFQAILALAAFPLLALASPQIYGPAPGGNNAPSSTSASASAAAAAPSAPPDTPGQVNVDVGLNGFTYSPSSFNASAGTLVTFYIASGVIPHSIVQSSFEDPCTPLAATSSASGGFDSGETIGQQFTINITDDTAPIWFFCEVPLHCGMGMVGVINPPTSGNNTFASFQAAAMAIGSGEPTVSSTGVVLGGVGANATSPPTSAGAAASGSSSSSSSSGASRTAVTSILAVALIVMPIALLL